MIWILIGVLFVAALFLTFKASTLTAGETGKIDTSGWTENEIMNYEMHGVIPARAGTTGASTASSGGMVGGC